MKVDYLRLVFLGHDLVEVDAYRAESAEEASKHLPFPFGDIALKSSLVTMKVVQVSEILKLAGVYEGAKSVV